MIDAPQEITNPPQPGKIEEEMLPKIELNKKRVGSLVGDVEALVAGIGHKSVGNILHRQKLIGTKERKNQNRIKKSVEKAAKKAELMMKM